MISIRLIIGFSARAANSRSRRSRRPGVARDRPVLAVSRERTACAACQASADYRVFQADKACQACQDNVIRALETELREILDLPEITEILDLPEMTEILDLPALLVFRVHLAKKVFQGRE